MKRILFSCAMLLACAACALRPIETQAEPGASSDGAAAHHVFLPVAHRAECRTHTALMTLSPTATTLSVGELVTVTARLSNVGCVALGLPRYWLHWETDKTEPVVEPVTALDVVHHLAVVPWHHDEARFVLRAVGSGRAMLRAHASFEVHLSYPGPAYWGGSTSLPLNITVAPQTGPWVLEAGHSARQASRRIAGHALRGDPLRARCAAQPAEQRSLAD